MTRTKIVAIVGLSEEEEAHLRLLLRKNAAQIVPPWRCGEEGGADLVIVDRGSFAGQMAFTRARGTGVRCADFTDRPSADSGLLLARPLRGGALVELLNRIGAESVGYEGVGTNTADFYTRDIGDERAPAAAPRDDEPVAAGLDELLRPKPKELRTPPPPSSASPPPPPAASTPPEWTLVEPVRAEPASTDRVGGRQARQAAQLDELAPFGLSDWIDNGRLQSPARFTLGNARPLVLDPKNHVAWIAGGLRSLEPYCRAQWRRSDWQPLTTADMEEVRDTCTTLSWVRIRWLLALLASDGQLARHLDPGGTYRLTQWLGIEKDFERQSRIAAAMMQARRLHEIAAASGIPMAEVFDFINACEAVGLIEWTPRQRREEAAAKPASLFSRLRQTLGKS